MVDLEKIDVLKCSCGNKITEQNSYRCRICKVYFCEECSLEHFGLIEKDGAVTYKNIFKTIFWFFNKKFF